MVAVEHYFAIGDVGDRVKTGAFLDLHADLEAIAIPLGGLKAHEVGVVVAEGLVGLELKLHRRAGSLAFERALQRAEELAVAAVQVSKIGRGLQLYALRVVQLDPQAYNGVLPYERRRLTTSKTSAACPRGLMP